MLNMDMRSLICKACDEIIKTGKLELFKSYKKEYSNGEQKRDFVYVKDVVNIMYDLRKKQNIRGLFNLGTGIARSWNDLAKAVFTAMDKKTEIIYKDMPEFLKNKYQYFTQADMSKLKSVNINCKFQTLEDSVKDYVSNYLLTGKYL